MEFNNFTIILSPHFQKELQKIYEYIAYKLKEPIIAKKFYREIIGSLNSLKTFPECYPKILLNHNKTTQDIRKINFKNYIIIYSINYSNKEVYILHIFHGNQDYFNLL